MKEVTVQAWCDGHHPEGRINAPNERTMTLNGGSAVVLDLCDRCLDSLVALYEAGGHPPTNVSRGTLPVNSTTCPECGLVSASRSALGQHLRRAHDTGIKDYPKG